MGFWNKTVERFPKATIKEKTADLKSCTHKMKSIISDVAPLYLFELIDYDW